MAQIRARASGASEGEEGAMNERIDPERPLYLISVVAELLGVHPQTLRAYEREGLVAPSRAGNQRMYSQADMDRLRLIIDLTRNLGVNRAGVDIILRMRYRLECIQHEMEEMLHALHEEQRAEFRRKIQKIFDEEE